MQNIAKTHYYVQRTKAIHHKHFLMGNLCLKTVGKKQQLKYICQCTTKITNSLEDMIYIIKKERKNKKHRCEGNKQIAQKKHNIIAMPVTFMHKFFPVRYCNIHPALHFFQKITHTLRL